MITDSIESKLQLEIKDKKISIPGANIKICHLDLSKSAFSGYIEFWLSYEKESDKLTEAFSGDELIKLNLTLKNYTFSKKDEAEEITLKALVSERSIYEAQYLEIKKSKIIFRKYACYFTDAAQFIWSQHFPCELYVDKTLKDVITAQIIEPITIKLTWDKLAEKEAIICIGMGAYDLSFYDFLIDYLEDQCAYMLYDYKTNSYEIVDKIEYPAKENGFLPHQVNNVHVQIPKSNYQSANVLNGNTDNAKITVVNENKAVQKLKNDVLLTTPFPKTVEAQKTLETTRNGKSLAKLKMTFKMFPMKPIVPLSAISLTHELWNKESLFYKKKYLVSSVSIKMEAVNQDVESDLNLEFNQYSLVYDLLCTEKGSVDFKRPISRIKAFFVEGLLLCETGEDTDKTYQYKQNDDTKQNEYRIKVPLWDLEIKVVFKPDFIHPHFYFPLYKDTRVRLEMNLFYARVDRILDWGKTVFLDQETQGNHLLFGKNEKDETSLKHVYEDNKPVFSILRSKEKDNELFRMEEGIMILETKEDE